MGGALVRISPLPEAVIEQVASRPRGGAHRAAKVDHRRERRLRRRAGRRAADPMSGVHVDAFDATETLWRHASYFWAPEHILAHPEIARIATAAALGDIETRKTQLRPHCWLTQHGWRAANAIEAARREVVHASQLLAVAHAAGAIGAAA